MTTIEYSGRDNLDVMVEARCYNRYLTKLILNWLGHKGPLVDFGAGSGTFAVEVARAGLDVSCIETDPVLAATLRSKGLQVESELESYPDGSLAGLYSLNVLEHIEEDDTVLALWHRKLAPGGRLLVYVPAFQVLFSSMDRKVGHHRRYRKGPLKQQLAAAGFDIENIRYADSLGFVAALAYRTIDSGRGEINPATLRLYDRWVFPISKLLDKFLGRWIGKNVFAYATKR